MAKSNLPMLATLFRILLAPVIIVIIMLECSYWNWITAILFVIASITDWLDGYWARKYKSVTDLGRFLDPVADKILVSSILIMLIPLQRVEAVAVLIILNRDIVIGGLRSFAASKGTVIAADTLGKWKTAVQMVAIPSILLHNDFLHIPWQQIGYWGIWLSLVLSLISGFQYVMKFLQSSNVRVL